MIAKISSGKSLFGALSYNQEKVDEGVANVLFSQNIVRTVDGSYNMALCMRSFKPYLSANNKTRNPVIHISLNPHPDDVLTDEQLGNIAQEYMEKLGYGKQPYLVYKHEDIDRKHIHIVSIRIDGTGKKINDSFEKKRSDEIRKDLEKKYHLLPAEKQKQSDNLPLKRVDYKAGDVKKQVSSVAKAVMKGYRFQSLNEYRTVLSIYGVTVEEVKGEIRGKAYNGLVYSALDKKGEKVGNPFKASLIGRSVGYSALQKQITTSKQSMKDKVAYNRSRNIITSLLVDNPNRKTFEKELAKNGISVLFRENEDRRIYGVTFIDHQEKAVFNGSRLGKEFSANVFHELFNKDKTDNHEQNLDKSFGNSNDFNEQDSAVEAVAGLFSMEQHGDNYEEIAFTNRMKRKKKRRNPRL
ncbi:MAG: conjugal transfer protein MobB [Dysgonomonas mossii]|uniref:conjugal transfer protein MobB n=1 Tax=Dysgonomonas mossii TaxID=163665 RepID=UPI003991992D